MPTLPITFADKVNNPEALAYLAQYGINEQLTAEEINQIRDGINTLYAGQHANEILSQAGFFVEGTNFKANANFHWAIAGIAHTNTALISIAIPDAVGVKQRYDDFYLNTSNGITRVPGPEVNENPIHPAAPENALFLTSIFINGNVIGEPEDPFTGPVYVTKAEKGLVKLQSLGSGIFNPLVINERVNFLITGGVTEIRNLSFSNVYGSYVGQETTFTNLQPEPVLFRHNTGPGTKLMNVEGEDVLVQQNESINFYFRSKTQAVQNGVRKISEELLEILESKLNIADYNQNFRGKYTSEANLNAAHPTANDGDYAIVDAGGGSAAKEYIWDAEEGWVLGNSVGATTTDTLTEGSTNLYHTAARVMAAVLTGFSTVSGGAVVSTDSVLVAFGKIQNTLNGLSSIYQVILVSGTNIKTVNGNSLLGSGDLTISGGGSSGGEVIRQQIGNFDLPTANRWYGYNRNYQYMWSAPIGEFGSGTTPTGLADAGGFRIIGRNTFKKMVFNCVRGSGQDIEICLAVGDYDDLRTFPNLQFFTATFVNTNGSDVSFEFVLPTNTISNQTSFAPFFRRTAGTNYAPMTELIYYFE